MPEKVVIDGHELWHGDCREVLPLLAHVDLVLTDPPYGIGIINLPPSAVRLNCVLGRRWRSAPTVEQLAQRLQTSGVDLGPVTRKQAQRTLHQLLVFWLLWARHGGSIRDADSA